MASPSPSDDKTDSQPEEETGATGGPAGGTRDRAQDPSNVQIKKVDVHIKKAVFQPKVMKVQQPIVFMGNPCRMRFNRPSSNTRDEALRPTPPPEDLSSLFEPQDLKRGLEETLFVPIAKSFDQQSNWRWLGRKLEIDVPVFNRLCDLYSEDVPELVQKMLVFYKRKNPLKTMGDVVKALCDSRNQMAVTALKKYLDEQKTE